MAHDFYTNDGEKHEGISSVKLPADAGGTETVEFLADNEVTKNDKIQQTKAVTLSTSGVVEPDAGYDAVRSVAVTVQGGGEVEVQPVKSVTMSESGTVTPDDGYDAMASVNVTIPSVEPAPVNISVSASGVVTAYGDGVTTETHQLSSADDADFVAANIKKNVNIFGVTGTYQPIIPPAGNVTLGVTATTDTYDVGTDISDIIDDITASLAFPDGETELEITDKSSMTAVNVTTEGSTVALGTNVIRFYFGGLHDDVEIVGAQEPGTITFDPPTMSVTYTQRPRPTLTAHASEELGSDYHWSVEESHASDLILAAQVDTPPNQVIIRINNAEYTGDIKVYCTVGNVTAEYTVTVTA